MNASLPLAFLLCCEVYLFMSTSDVFCLQGLEVHAARGSEIAGKHADALGTD